MEYSGAQTESAVENSDESSRDYYNLVRMRQKSRRELDVDLRLYLFTIITLHFYSILLTHSLGTYSSPSSSKIGSVRPNFLPTFVVLRGVGGGLFLWPKSSCRLSRFVGNQKFKPDLTVLLLLLSLPVYTCFWYSRMHV